MNKIDVGNDFSKYPAGRYVSDGPYSGEAFRETHLKPALSNNADVEVLLDTSVGYGSSFLEEAFGGLVRCEYFTKEHLRKHLNLVSEDSSLIEEAWSYIEDCE